MLNKNTLGIKKCGANKKQPYLCATKRFDISWGQEVTYQRCFKLLEWHIIHSLVYSIFSQVWSALSLGHLHNNFGMKKGGQVTKPTILVKICYKLYVIQVVWNIFDWWLLGLSWYQSFWSHIGRTASYWPWTFFTLRVFLFSISLLFVNKSLLCGSI